MTSHGLDYLTGSQVVVKLPCLIESLEQAFSWVGLKPCQARLGFLIMQGHGIMCTPKPLQEKKSVQQRGGGQN
jgi:hypothetical protein